MLHKSIFYLLAWTTLIVFPAIGFGLLWYFEDIAFIDLLELDLFYSPLTLLGLLFGFLYAFLVILITQAPIFEEGTALQKRLIGDLKLNFIDILFMSLCAGIGEEILFRVSIQTWLGPILTSILFVAIHGYFSFKNPKTNYSGLVVLPFILIIAYAYIEFGLWFVVAAHFAYDVLILYYTVKEASNKLTE